MKQILISRTAENATPQITKALKQIVSGEKMILRFENGVYRTEFFFTEV